MADLGAAVALCFKRDDAGYLAVASTLRMAFTVRRNSERAERAERDAIWLQIRIPVPIAFMNAAVATVWACERGSLCFTHHVNHLDQTRERMRCPNDEFGCIRRLIHRKVNSDGEFFTLHR